MYSNYNVYRSCAAWLEELNINYIHLYMHAFTYKKLNLYFRLSDVKFIDPLVKMGLLCAPTTPFNFPICRGKSINPSYPGNNFYFSRCSPQILKRRTLNWMLLIKSLLYTFFHILIAIFPLFDTRIVPTMIIDVISLPKVHDSSCLNISK